jgi:tetratricopeptide (TPR) repeat protein
MFRSKLLTTALMACLTLAAAALSARADELRNLKRGEPMPSYKLATIEGGSFDSEACKGSVVVMVCLSAEQRSSELAAMDSRTVVHEFAADGVKLVHITADVVQKAYFERFRQDRGLDVPLAFDADRALYGKLGLIVFPTTIVVNREGKLVDVISLRGSDYSHVLDAYLRHTLGKITDAQLAEELKARPSTESSPKSLASAHRAAARLMREKGRTDAAREELTKAREQDPSNADILLDLADLDLATAQLDDADALIKSVLAAQPEHRRAKQLKGILLYRRNQLPEAEAALLEALALNPEPGRIHYYLGKIYEQQGKPDKALQHYREALDQFFKESDAGAGTPTPK